MTKIKTNLMKDVKDDPNFEEQLQNYWNQAELSGNLMAQLRSLIIKDFNKSRLGREIHLQHKRNTVINPLELVIGAFVAEYLYAQGHHFSLSLLFAESNQIFPNFERTDNFRFHKHEINEILDAIGVQTPLKQSIASQYQAGSSLLHCFFKASLKKADKPATPKTSETPIVAHEIKNLHASLAALLKLVQEMGSTQHPMFSTLLKNLESFNKNLEKFTGTNEKRSEKSPIASEQKLKFTDWVLELTASEMGKRYLKKLRSLVLRLIHKEKKKLKQKYRSRYKYKKSPTPPSPPPLPRKTQSTETDHDMTIQPEQVKSINKLVTNKLSSLDIEETELKLKLLKLEEKLKFCETQTREIRNSVQQKKAKRKSILVKSHSVDIPTISDPENVIKSMKDRVESLEAESEKLYSSFKAYLDKKDKQQITDELTKEKVTVWQQLQTSRVNLEKYAKPVITVASPPIFDQTPMINLSSSTESKKSSPKEYRNPFHEIKLEDVLKQRNNQGRNIQVGQQASDALRKHFNEVWKPVPKVQDKENLQELHDLRKQKVSKKTDQKVQEIRELNLNETFLKEMEKMYKPDVNIRTDKGINSEVSKATSSLNTEEPPIQKVNMNETFPSERNKETSKDSSQNSRRSNDKSSTMEKIAPPPVPTEAKVTVINHQQSESSRSISGDKGVISTGNLTSAASDDFWD